MPLGSVGAPALTLARMSVCGAAAIPAQCLLAQLSTGSVHLPFVRLWRRWLGARSHGMVRAEHYLRRVEHSSRAPPGSQGSPTSPMPGTSHPGIREVSHVSHSPKTLRKILPRFGDDCTPHRGRWPAHAGRRGVPERDAPHPLPPLPVVHGRRGTTSPGAFGKCERAAPRGRHVTVQRASGTVSAPVHTRRSTTQGVTEVQASRRGSTQCFGQRDYWSNTDTLGDCFDTGFLKSSEYVASPDASVGSCYILRSHK